MISGPRRRRPLKLAITREDGKQFLQVKPDFPENVAKIALAIFRARGEKPLRRYVKRIIPNQCAFHEQVAVDGNGGKKVRDFQLFYIVLTQGYAGVLLDKIIQASVHLKELRHGDPLRLRPNPLFQPADGRSVNALGLGKKSLYPIQQIARIGCLRRELQRLVAQMPLHVYGEFAEAREHTGAEGGGRQVTTPVAQAQTFAYEFRPPGGPVATPVHDGQVFIAVQGNPRVEIGKDAGRRWELVRQPRFSPREF